ncbi:hypothetical protein [Streptoalloteichus hindustanus]|uniref:S1 motif domain-containing protein n=1 Tax=Streptoalloteichus hindustanus TaxID=2017 RepID=A0A1M4UFP3_STRHI|nr:hypothetical protein [Streptoalloteichus hindustanus]SHE55474.1 hypothetical protein SAMN05444320_101405 [Streptoalloteichus hindustanus]
MPGIEEWERLRPTLRLGQWLSGAVVRPPSCVAGVFVDLGLPVAGFVDVALLPSDQGRWPGDGEVLDFEIWWMDEQPQIRLKPLKREYLCEDFEGYVARNGWPEGHPGAAGR